MCRPMGRLESLKQEKMAEVFILWDYLEASVRRQNLPCEVNYKLSVDSYIPQLIIILHTNQLYELGCKAKYITFKNNVYKYIFSIRL